MNPPLFTQEVALRDGVRTFYFYRLPASYPAYRVEVEWDGGARVSFSMIRQAGSYWIATAHRLPLWIAEAEATLAATLDAQELFV